ncbi:MAG: DUF885 domain-containing protein [Acidobacteria bacterium]|nr:DUF885 domain-containing protein [Acidobacteriota bacterium]
MKTSMPARVVALAALVGLVALGLPPTSIGGQEHGGVAQLAEELRARSGPGFWGDTDGPLVRDRLPGLSEAAAREHAQWSADFLRRVNAIKTDTLGHNDWITWSLLRWEGEMGAAGGEFYWHEPPISPYSSPLRTVTTGFAAAPLSNAEGRLRYLDGLHQLPVLLAQIETKLRGQVIRGIVLPAGQVDAAVPLIRSFGAPPERSSFIIAERRLDAVPAEARDAFASAVRRAITEVVNPAVEHLATYVDGPYRDRASNDVGVGRYPGGDRYYRFMVRHHTGLELTPQQIHEIGLNEVGRLERELETVRRQAGFAGSLAEFRTFLKTDPRFFPTSPAQMGDALMAAAKKIEPAIGAWFIERPKAPYGARRLAPALEPVMTYGYYQRPTPPQDPGGYYLFNGSKLEDRSLLNAAALSYHELVPGHHFQIALTQENTRLSAFRKNALYTAFVEGWGEYASDLAGEMGMYADPYDRAGRLSMDLFLSTRLVVDTGMNALGWSRERAMDYMRAHTFESETQIRTESLRYSADMPGQALAYKMGSRTIRALRERMRAQLGVRFDVRRFHQAILGHGSMPLGLLEQHVERVLSGTAGVRARDAW